VCLGVWNHATAAPRTGILDTMRSAEAIRVWGALWGGANPPVGEGVERRGALISSIVRRPQDRRVALE